MKVDTVSCIEPVIFDSVEKLVEGACRILHNMGKSRKSVFVYRVFSYIMYYDGKVVTNDWDCKYVSGCSGVSRALMLKVKRPLLAVITIEPIGSDITFTLIGVNKSLVTINMIGKIISSLTGGVEFYYDRCLKKFI